jgi:sortase A
MLKKIIFISALSFLTYWIAFILFPILGVEAEYQYKKVLRNQFHFSDLQRATFVTDGIQIPALFVDEPVVYNVDPTNPEVYKRALLQGVAHASGTAFPGTGGLGYYFAHSSSAIHIRQYNAAFYLLGKLHDGDTIYVYHQNEKFVYSVYESTVTSPGDLSFLHQTYPTETIVLQTCWPPGTTIQRLLVFAKRTQ